MKRISWKASPAVKKFGLVFSGSAAAQLLPLLVSPLLARLYRPEQFGQYALFVSGVNLLSQLACLKYDFALLTARDSAEAEGLFRLSLWCSTGWAALCCLAWPFAAPFSRALGASGSGWLYLLPAGVWLTGAHSALQYRASRESDFRAVARSGVLRAAVLSLAQAVLAPLGGVALIGGHLLGYAAGCLALFRRGKQREASAPLGRVARAYAAFPRYTMPGALCGAASANLSSFLLSALYSQQELGYYTMLNRLLSAPLALVTGAVGQVYTRELAQEDGGRGRRFRFLSGGLAALAAPSFGILFLLTRPLLGLALGAPWREAAGMLRLLIPLAAVRFVVVPVSSTGVVLGRQRATLVWQASMLAASLAPFAVSRIHPVGLGSYLFLQTLLLVICYAVFWLYCNHLMKGGGAHVRQMGTSF